MAGGTGLAGVGDRILYVLVTGFGTGLAPVAPGTFGTLPAVVTGILLQQVFTGRTLAWVLCAVAAVLLLIGCLTTGFVDRAFATKDPGSFVLDEIVGYLLALAILAAWQQNGPTPVGHAACFVLFRAFDILKPPLVSHAEELSGAMGIMMDDVVAGIYAGLALIALDAFDLLS